MIVVGGLFLPMMALVHPRMRPARLSAWAGSGTVGPDSGGEVALAKPGLFGRGWRAITPAGMVMGHAVYGPVLALTSGRLA